MSTNNPNGDAKSKRHNFVNFTLQIGKDGEGKYAQNGKPFATARAFFSQGKAKDSDEFLPSIWFKVMAFGKEGDDFDSNPTLATLANAQKGVKVDVKGRIGMEEWIGEDGEKRSTLVIYASEVKPAETGDAAAEEEPQP